jgi:hypothetical protein
MMWGRPPRPSSRAQRSAGSAQIPGGAGFSSLRQDTDRMPGLATAPYSPAPIITIGIVGVAAPASFSTVIAKALASTPSGSGGFTMLALP